MHISILAFGTWGDVRPNVVLGNALKERGHHVQIIASSDFESWIQGHGLEYYPLSVNVQDIIDQLTTDTLNFFQAIKAIKELITPAMLTLGLETLDATRDSDILLTHESGVSVLSGVVAKHNLKVVRVNLQPLTPTHEFSSPGAPVMPSWFPFRSWYNWISYRLIQRSQWFLLGSRGNTLRTEHLNMAKMKWKEYVAYAEAIPTVNAISKHLVPRPSDWHSNQYMTGFLFDDETDWVPPQDLLDFLDAGAQPIYIGFGSMGDKNPERTTEIIMSAVKQSGKRAVLLSGWAGIGAEEVPDSIYLLRYAPHYWLFPKMSTVVHHGGAGTSASGIRAGVPSVIVPHAADQPFWANRLHDLGAGTLPIPKNKLTAENLAEAIHVATSSSELKHNANILGEKIRSEDSIGQAVDVVESISVVK